jgi:hypothetical protein
LISSVVVRILFSKEIAIDADGERTMNKGVCKLCCRNDDLRESHIIPEFFYQHVYDTGHVFYRLSSDSKRPKQARRGLYQELFCGSCESLFQTLENYVAAIWFSEELKSSIENNPV